MSNIVTGWGLFPKEVDEAIVYYYYINSHGYDCEKVADVSNLKVVSGTFKKVTASDHATGDPTATEEVQLDKTVVNDNDKAIAEIETYLRTTVFPSAEYKAWFLSKKGLTTEDVDIYNTNDDLVSDTGRENVDAVKDVLDGNAFIMPSGGVVVLKNFKKV